MSDENPENPEQPEQTPDPAADPPGEEAAEAEAVDPLELARSEAAKMKDMLVRTAADFDNFRKRSRREVEEARRSGREELLKELLPVFDNLERGIQSAQRATDVKAVADGLTMIVKQFEATLSRIGISRIPTTGSPFDPSLHEAIQQVETDEHPPGTVVAEVQPGYSAGDKLVRAAMVVVAKPRSDAGDGKPDA